MQLCKTASGVKTSYLKHLQCSCFVLLILKEKIYLSSLYCSINCSNTEFKFILSEFQHYKCKHTQTYGNYSCKIQFKYQKTTSIIVCETVAHIRLSTFSCHILCSLDNDKKSTDIYQVKSWPEKSSHSTNYVLLLQKPDCCVDSYT